MVFMPEQPLGHGRPIVLGEATRRSRLGPVVWRVRQVAKAAARRDYATARWLLTRGRRTSGAETRRRRLYTGPEPGEVAEWLKALAC